MTISPKQMVIIASILIVLVVVGVILWHFSSESEYSAKKPTAGENIVAFGDSLVAGMGASPGSGFVSLLSRRIGLPIINAGESGDTTAEALLRLESDVLSHNPRVVIILLGGNDFVLKIPTEEVFRNLGEIINKVQARGAGVILVGIRGSVFGSYQKNFEDLARRKKAGYVPNVLDGIFSNPQLMSDYIHPNDRGYEIMADRIEPVLREMIQ